jgi:hypothetical protein
MGHTLTEKISSGNPDMIRWIAANNICLSVENCILKVCAEQLSFIDLPLNTSQLLEYSVKFSMEVTSVVR